MAESLPCSSARWAGLGMLAFTATTYSQAIAGRVLSGLLCGTCILKTFLTEITDSNRRRLQRPVDQLEHRDGVRH